jgi:hypothetical protein
MPTPPIQSDLRLLHLLQPVRAHDSITAGLAGRNPSVPGISGSEIPHLLISEPLDVLEIRLHVLAGVIDRFVLVEARQTFQRGAKPLYYSENRSRFASFSDRIDHVVVDEFPEEAAGALACERSQRNEIRLGIKDAEPGDTILIS